MIKESNNLYLTCTDFTVTDEKFQLFWNTDKDILVTDPQPSAEELPKYYQSEAYISHTDAKNSFFERAYQGVKSLMLKRKLNLIGKYATKKTLLDFGAGTGDFLAEAKKQGWEVSGVEPSSNARKLAAKKELRLAENEQTLSGKYEVITLWHVLEHLPDLKQKLETFHRLLNDEGTLVIAVPNFESYDAQYYKEFWAAYDVPRHLWHFSQAGIENVLGQFGFSLTKVLPLPFDAYYVSMLSEKYKTGSVNYLKAFQVGFRSNRKARHSKNYSSHIYVFKKQNT